MMTVTEENLDQVIPLARALEGKVDSFNFNRHLEWEKGPRFSFPNRKSIAVYYRNIFRRSQNIPIDR
jgi:hypothetical protein